MNDKQTRFVAEYLVDLNATQAVIRAGFSKATAHAIGHENLSKREIATAIAEAQEGRAKRTAIDADRVLAELGALGLYDPADIASTPMSGPADIGKLPESVRRAIIGWGWDKKGRFTLKLSPKVPALVEIGKHLGLAQRAEVMGMNGGPIEVAEPPTDRVAHAMLSLIHASLVEKS